VAERLVVPLRPGNAGGGKEPQFKTNAASSEGLEIGQPNNSEKCSEAADGVARESEGIAGVPLLRAVRQDQPRGHPGPRLGKCRSNQGAPGTDGQDFADVEAYGVERWLGELALALRQETYRPDPIRRVFIPKANSTAKSPKLRPLGISTLRDRVCMTAAMLVLDPIFEADLPPEQYAYRQGRNAQQAVVEVQETLFRGHPEVVDADLADYFGSRLCENALRVECDEMSSLQIALGAIFSTSPRVKRPPTFLSGGVFTQARSIPHAELMLSLARRIVDRRVLHLIKMWLECAVEETDDRGRKTCTTEAKDRRRGIPQGSPISPLLANLYMRRFVLGWKKFGLDRSLGTRIVTYADDLVILCRKGRAEEALQRMRQLMGKLKLTVNEEKTRICKVPQGEFDFLGYTFGRMYSKTTGIARLGMRPSKKSIRRMVEKIHELTALKTGWQETTAMVGKLNRTLRGWANYFQVGTVSGAYRALDNYTAPRLRRWLRNKHKVRKSRGWDLSTLTPLRALRLVRLTALGRDVAWVKA